MGWGCEMYMKMCSAAHSLPESVFCCREENHDRGNPVKEYI